MSWSFREIQQLCKITRGASPRPIQNWMTEREDGIPWIKISDATSSGGRTIERTAGRILREGEEKSVSVYEGDLILSNSATPGIPKFVGIHSCIHDGWLLLREFKDTVPEFLFYLLKHERRNLVAQGNGSVFTNLKTDILKNHQVSVPPLTEQKAIAHILGTLDDKIELNQKMNQTLEEIAKAIFKSWFVDFDPVRAKAEGRPTGLPPEISDLFPHELVDSEIGEIPKGWEVAPLDEIGNFRNGLALQKYPAEEGEEQLPVVKIAQLRKGSTDGDDLFASGVPSDFVITDGDYVFSWSGSLMAKYWVGGKGALNQHLFKVEEKTQPLWFIAGWVEHFMPEFQSIAESKATTMGHIKREHLKQAICAIPSQELIKRSAEVITPLIERSILSQQESKVLSELRDTLLPKLISGELRIPDAEKFLEQAGL